VEDILTNLYNNNTEHIKLVPLGKIRVKLMGLRNNLYLQQTYRAVAKNTTKEDHDYTIAEFPFVASWAPFLRNTSTNIQVSNLADRPMGYKDVRTSGQGTSRETMFFVQVFTFFILCRSRGYVGTSSFP
jgi:hypothetical protein